MLLSKDAWSRSKPYKHPHQKLSHVTHFAKLILRFSLGQVLNLPRDRLLFLSIDTHRQRLTSAIYVFKTPAIDERPVSQINLINNIIASRQDGKDFTLSLHQITTFVCRWRQFGTRPTNEACRRERSSNNLCLRSMTDDEEHGNDNGPEMSRGLIDGLWILKLTRCCLGSRSRSPQPNPRRRGSQAQA